MEVHKSKLSVAENQSKLNSSHQHHTKEYYIKCCPRHWRQKEHKILTSWKNGGNKDKPSFVGQEGDPSS